MESGKGGIAMTHTIERTQESTQNVASGGSRSWLVRVSALLLAVAVGVLIGWVIGAKDDDTDLDLITADGSALTEEQEEMALMLDKYLDALRNGEYTAAESWFFDDGDLVWGGFEVPYGDFAAFFSNMDFGLDQEIDRALVFEEFIVFFHKTDSGETQVDVVRFGDFAQGEFHIEEHVVTG
jgi:hypothetical protein